MAATDHIDDIIKYESGDMTQEEQIKFIQRMIDDGTVWHLQGSYGRMATTLIRAGVCHQKQ